MKPIPKYLIVFGAGASFGSDNDFVTPPIATGLFNALVRFDPISWAKIREQEARKFREDFEQAMEGLLSDPNYGTRIAELQLKMAAYFFQFTPRKQSLYLRLAEKINSSNWDGGIVSYNYERLLELSLRKYGFQPVCREKGNPKEIEICLPHGACHIFIREAQGDKRAGNIKLNLSIPGGRVQFDGNPYCINDPMKYVEKIRREFIPPVMCYFIPSKTSNSGVTFLEQQKARSSQLICQAEKITVVGLKVRPHDKHIWDPFAHTSAQIIYCSGESAGKEYKAWAKGNRDGNKDIVLAGYFSHEFDELCNNLGLK